MSHGRRILALVVALVVGGPLCAHAAEADATQQNDAQLTSVMFVDADYGWAVGDRGTIWHTNDGGQTWQLQRSHVDCRLSCVYFLDRQTGWAAGGWTHPFTHITSGIVLRTRDGGATWTADRRSILPALRSIKFFNANLGIAVGQSSSLFPAGVMTTDDGGRSWAALPAGEEQAWLAGGFADQATGLLVGRHGTVAQVKRKAIQKSPGANFGLRNIHAVRLGRAGCAWLVGDGGLVMQTQDAGLTWQPPQAALPAEFRDQFDLQCFDLRDDHLWLAGSPGTCVLHSTDGGQSWQMQSTQHRTPLRSIYFVDKQRGWAVGDFGAILATTDGGRTWRTQRSGGSRAALLGILSEPTDVPLEMFAKHSGDAGYLGVVEILHRNDAELRALYASETPDRTHEALVLSGASVAQTAWRFPSRQPGLGLTTEQMINAWNRATDGQALARMDQHLVLALRMWRPNVVVTTLTSNPTDTARAQLVNQIVLRAIEHAADPAAFPEQRAIGLEPWTITKAFGTLVEGSQGSVTLVSAETSRNGRSVADLAAPARGVIHRAYTPSPISIGFRQMLDNLPQETTSRDLFSGIHLSPGSEARRQLREAPEQTIEAIRRSAQARRNLNAILARYDERGLDDGRYLAEVSDLVRTMDQNHGAEVLLQLARRYHDRGQWDLAADTYDAVVERYPHHSGAGAALVWLVQYYASSEADWRARGQQQFSAREDSAPLTATETTNELRAPTRRVQRATAVVNLGSGNVDRYTRAAGYAKQLEQHSAALFAEPEVRFPLAAAHRHQGFPRQADRFFLGFVRGRPQDAWWACAQWEVARFNQAEGDAAATEAGAATPGLPADSALKPRYTCARVNSKPRLDGKLNDAIWRTAKPMELKSQLRDDREWPAVVMLAHDGQFLYLAASCREASTTQYVEAQGTRVRDSDLTAHDRIELYIDLDRDYTTAYCLSVDHRGWTHESCWGDSTWNPRWFVAADRSDDGPEGRTWTIEAAIALSDLSPELQPNQLWSLGVQRIVPNTGFQSWTQPAAVQPRGEGFGLMLLE